MVDLATLKGLHPRLSDVPCIYYFHENQFAYPVSDNQVRSVEPMMVQLYGALAADQLLFNSVYNRDSFLRGVDELLTRFPDNTPEGVTRQLSDKCDVLPLAIECIEHSQQKSRKLILWNHRWEYDKAPEVFAEALVKLHHRGVEFELALLGQRPLNKPDSLRRIEEQLSDHIIVNAMLDREAYIGYVARSAIVVSTAIHEFQGVSVLEAVSAGAVPIVPDGLCYREQYAEAFRYRAGDAEALANRLAWYLETPPDPPDVSYWSGQSLLEDWRQRLLDRLD